MKNTKSKLDICQSGSYIYNKTFANFVSLEFTAAHSDKATYHAYHEIYSHILYNREVKNFLEIGLFLGDSQHTDLFSWSNIYPEANIFGADIKKDFLFERGNIKTFYVDQDDNESLINLKKSLPNNLDVILDDASHMLDKTIKTFEVMFDSVKSGGLYLIEDILIRRYSDQDWEQNAEQINDYFSGTGLNYSIFSSSTIEKCVDSIVLCVYK